jgi:hypothetical protein
VESKPKKEKDMSVKQGVLFGDGASEGGEGERRGSRRVNIMKVLHVHV